MKFALSRENLSLEFATRLGLNQPVQLLARTLLASLLVCAFIGLKQQITGFSL